MCEKSIGKQTKNKDSIKLQAMLKTLPDFCKEFFQSIELVTKCKTRIAYACDLGVFFDYLKKADLFSNKTPICNMKLIFLDQIKPIDIKNYMVYLSNYSSDNLQRVNSECGKKRKLVSVRNLYNYFYKKEMILTNPALIIDIPIITNKKVVPLENNEIVQLLDEVENAKKMTATQQDYHKITKTRDIAIMTLLLGTGIRVSECVRLDINDLDCANNGLKIKRKEDYEITIYFDDEVKKALLKYLNERKQMIALYNDKNALFLSLQMRRLNVRSLQNLVKKYGSTLIKRKTITPHSLRTTYGANLYRETNNANLVADILGNKDLRTTKLNYIFDEENHDLQTLFD